MGDDLARAFVSFFVIVDPVGNLVVFHLMTAHMVTRQQVQVAALAVIAAGVMLVTFALAGEDVLDFLNISPEAFRVAAGLLLLIPAYRMVSQGQFYEPAAEASPDPIDIALVPFATPLMAGPGSLAAATSFADDLGAAETIGGIVLVLAVSFVACVSSHRLFALLGASTFRLLTRLVGILLVAISVDFVISGLQASFPGLQS
jgi:multiple antibiotic resistance protein